MKIEIYILPNARRSEYAGDHAGRVKIKIASPAVDNAANIELVSFVAQKLGVAKKSIKIIHGEKSRNKILEINGCETVSEFIDKISSK